MDIRTSGGPPTDAETAAVDGVLGPPASLWEGGHRTPADDHLARGGHASRSRRDLLLPVLHALQDEVGWVSRGGLEYACRRLNVPPAEAYGVATFYDRFALDEQPPLTVTVCDDIVCKGHGADDLIRELGDAAVRRSPCLGLCDRAPAARMERSGRAHAEGRLAPASIDAIKDLLGGGKWPDDDAAPVIGGTPKLLRRVGVIDPESLDSYRAAGGYTALRKAVEIGPEAVIREVTEAKLLGRGGAAFPAGRKWDSVARAPVHPHYLVCNADESEPGTFKDRVLMENDPFAVVEAMAIAAFATGCEKGFIYVRTEYPLARRRIENAISQSRGLLGVELEVRRGAGAIMFCTRCSSANGRRRAPEGRRLRERRWRSSSIR